MGKKPRVLITGIQGSGTTFMAQLFKELGYDLGSPLYKLSNRQGNEWEPLRDLKIEVDQAMMDHGASIDTNSPFLEGLRAPGAVRQDFHTRLQALDYPLVVKITGLGMAGRVMLPEIDAKHVVLMVRPLDDWIISEVAQGKKGNPAIASDAMVRKQFEGQRYNAAASAPGLVIDTLEKYAIAWQIASYPRVAENAAYAYGRLHDIVISEGILYPDFEKAWMRATNPDYIGYSERKL
jgi:hypothetical protein